MIQPEFEIKYIATNTTTVIATGKVLLHTVVCPIATTGTVTLQDKITPTTYFVLPIGSIGTFTFDASLPSGLDAVTSAADKVIITYQK